MAVKTEIYRDVSATLHLTFQKLELLQETGYHKRVTEVQQESAEYHTRIVHIQRMRSRAHVANCNLMEEEIGGEPGITFF